MKNSISARTLGASHIALFLQMNFSTDKNQIDTVFDQNENSEIDTINPSITLFSFMPAFSIGITDFIDLSGFFPLNFDIMSQFSPEGGFGDAEFGAKIRVPVPEKNIFQSAIYTSLSLPTGHQNAGFSSRSPWNYNDVDTTYSSVTSEQIGTYSNGKPESSLLALISLCFHNVLVHANSGVRFTLNPDVDNLFVLNGGLEFTPTSSITLFFDFGSTTQFSNVKNGFRINKDFMQCAPGIAVQSSGGTIFTFSGDFKLSSNEHKLYYDRDNIRRRILSRNGPKVGFTIQTGWNGFLRKPDRDGDLVFDKDDKCPDEKEDIDGFEDADGCPDPDNDNDGILDVMDKCPDEPEDKDGFEDEDGCPDFDNDKDNIPDSLDNCPNISEDIDGYEDLDGCPDYDNDGDGVADSLDKCIMIPEDIDSFQDDDGCPDIDNDMDGVPDSIDKCPDQAGTPKDDGCEPKKQIAKEIKFGRVILSGVDFGSGSAVLSDASYNVLDQIFASLEETPGIILEVLAHTDNSGDPQESVELSKKRAQVICDYLVGKGINSKRLIPVGKGGSDPIADNESVQGRKQNTRVEIHRKS